MSESLGGYLDDLAVVEKSSEELTKLLGAILRPDNMFKIYNQLRESVLRTSRTCIGDHGNRNFPISEDRTHGVAILWEWANDLLWH